MTDRRESLIGDPSQLDAFWRDAIARHDRTVWLSVIALGVAPEPAREIVQTTWARLIEQVRSGAVVDVKLPGLALTQARFLGIDELRRARRDARRHADVAELDVVHGTGDTEGDLVTRENLGRALRELGKCTAQQQHIFRLVYEDALPHTDVATEVGLSVQRVRQILCEVRSKLRTVLEEDR